MNIALAVYHFVRYHYYRVALDHIHPTNPDIVLISQRLIESRNIVNNFVENGNGMARKD